MRIRAEQLEAHLSKTLAGVYAIYGDEPLLALEAADAVRAAARSKGYTEREVLVTHQHFDWGELLHAGASLSLFGGRKILELRLVSGKPGAAGSDALRRYCAKPNPDNLLLVSMPRPQGPFWKAEWFAALESAGVTVEVEPLNRQRLPGWISTRLARNGQRAGSETLEFLADRVEGNLLAAHQEVQKLALLAPPGELSFEQVEAAVTNVARYAFEDLADALYTGDFARYVRALAGLRGEGESAAGLSWRLGEDLVAALRVRIALDAGRTREQAYTELRLWRSMQARVEKALRRFDQQHLWKAVRQVGLIERISKGAGVGDPWDEFVRLGLELLHGTEVAPKIG